MKNYNSIIKFWREGPGRWDRRFWICSAILWLLLLPQVNKPLHTDGPAYAVQARAVLEHPTRPYDFRRDLGDIGWRISYNPPLGAYILALPMAAFDGWEPGLHLAWFLLLWGTLAGLWSLAGRLGADPFAAGLVFSTSPVILVNGSEILFDIPLIFFWTSGLALLAIWLERKNPVWLWTAALCGAAASLCKYAGLLFVPLAFGWLWLRDRWKSGWPAWLLPLFAQAAWALASRLLYGEAHLLFAAGQVEMKWGLSKTLLFLSTLGLACSGPLASFFLMPPSSLRARLGWLGGAGLLLLFSAWALEGPIRQAGLSAGEAAQGVLLLTAGLCGAFGWVPLLVRLFQTARPADREGPFLAAGWMGLVFLYHMAWYLLMAARYLMPVVPALGLAAGLLVSRRLCSWRRMYAVCASAAGLSAWMGWADGKAAAVNAVYAKKTAAEFPHGGIFAAGLHGFDHAWEYYWQKEGLPVAMPHDSLLPSGSRLVLSRIAGGFLTWREGLHPDVRRHLIPRNLEKVIRYPDPQPLRTWHPKALAGFHANIYGVLPFGFSRAPLDEFWIYRIP